MLNKFKTSVLRIGYLNARRKPFALTSSMGTVYRRDGRRGALRISDSVSCEREAPREVPIAMKWEFDGG